jgi:hypothetical protein
MRRFRRGGPATADPGRPVSVKPTRHPSQPPVDAVASDKPPDPLPAGDPATIRRRPIASPGFGPGAPWRPVWFIFLGNDTLTAPESLPGAHTMSRPSLLACTAATPPNPPTAQPRSPPPETKRRGNPNLALVPRCGAHTRTGCPCRAPAIHGKRRCPAGQASGQAPHGGRGTPGLSACGLLGQAGARTVVRPILSQHGGSVLHVARGSDPDVV